MRSMFWRPGVTAPALILSMLVFSDYKLRLRPLGESLVARPDPNTMAEIAFYLGAFVLLGKLLLIGRGHRTPATPLVFFTWFYCSYMAMSVVWAIYPVLGAVRGWQFLISGMLCAVLARFGTRLDLHRTAIWFALLVSGSVIFGVLFQFPRLRLQQNRFNWLYVHPVIAGSFLGIAVIILLWLLWARFQGTAQVLWPLPLMFVMLALCVGGLLGTRTRGAIGGCVVGCVVLGLMALRRHRLDFVLTGLITLSLTYLFLLPRILEFLSRGEDASQISSFNGRAQLWAEAYDLFLARPLLGYGVTASRGLFWSKVALGGAHNAEVNVIIDGGLIGFGLWLAIGVSILRLLPRLLRIPAGAADGPVIGALLGFLVVNGVTTEGLGYVANVSATWLFVLVGWCAVLARELPPPARPGNGTLGTSRSVHTDEPQRRSARPHDIDQ